MSAGDTGGSTQRTAATHHSSASPALRRPSNTAERFGVCSRRLALAVKTDKRVTLIDADPQGSALDWSEQRAREGLPRLFGVIGLARDTLHREAPELARDARHVVIDGPPRISGPTRSALAKNEWDAPPIDAALARGDGFRRAGKPREVSASRSPDPVGRAIGLW